MATSDSTVWTCTVSTTGSGPVATLRVATNGGAPQELKLRGVVYSPCPMNGSNALGPALGDWFWDGFSGKGYAINGWDGVWGRDLPQIRSLGVNALRVYSMISRQLTPEGKFPSPWNGGHLFTHDRFLDACWNGGNNPVYVLVGIPLPDTMFWLNKYNEPGAGPAIDFWTHVLQETIGQLAGHPAVLGFTIQNELDGGSVTYGPDTAAVEFWWGQVVKLSGLAKAAIGNHGKLVGMATHDDPLIPGKAAKYMAQCPALDFWGVNSYQTQNFEPVFGPVPQVGPGYAGLTGAALKPVILTEWGMPATSHKNPSDDSTVYADDATIENTADATRRVAPTAYGPQPLGLGLFYFEFCDEWWNQPGSPNISTWWGGTSAPGFPNGYWDQDGFGLYSIARGGQLANDAPIWTQTGGYGGPTTPLDVHTARSAAVAALQTVFSSL